MHQILRHDNLICHVIYVFPKREKNSSTNNCVLSLSNFNFYIARAFFKESGIEA